MWTLQAVELAAQLGDYRCSHAGPTAQHLNQSASSSPGLVVPVFAVSSVTGLGLPVLHAFLNALPALPHAAIPLVQGHARQCPAAQHAPIHAAAAHHDRAHTSQLECNSTGTSCSSMVSAAPEPQTDMQTDNSGILGRAAAATHRSASQTAATHFQVDHTFEVKGGGCVVSGTVVSGEVAVGQTLNLGPSGEGLFREVQVTCIHRSQVWTLPCPLSCIKPAGLGLCMRAGKHPLVSFC